MTPRTKAWSLGSMVDVMSVAASESVLATAMRSVPEKSSAGLFPYD